MPKRRYPIEGYGPARVEVTWEGGLNYPVKNIRVFFDGALIGTFSKRIDLADGKQFTLPDETILSVRLENNDLRVFHEDHSLDEIKTKTGMIHPHAWIALGLSGLIEIALGIIFYLNFQDAWKEYGLPVIVNLLVGGIVFLGLSYWIKRKSSITLNVLYTSRILVGIQVILFSIAAIMHEEKIISYIFLSLLGLTNLIPGAFSLWKISRHKSQNPQ